MIRGPRGRRSFVTSVASGLLVLLTAHALAQDCTDYGPSQPSAMHPVAGVPISSMVSGQTLVSAGDRLYAANPLLREIDITDPTNPIFVGTHGLIHAWGAVVGDGNLWIYDGFEYFETVDGWTTGYSLPDLQLLGSASTEGIGYRAAYQNGELHVAWWGYEPGVFNTYGLSTVDVTDPANPIPMTDLLPQGSFEYIEDLVAVGNHLVICHGNRVTGYSTLAPTRGSIVFDVDMGSNMAALATDGNRLFATTTDGMLMSATVDPWGAITIHSTELLPRRPWQMSVSGNELYASLLGSGVLVVDVSDLTNPVPLNHWAEIHEPGPVTVVAGQAFVADGELGVVRVDLGSQPVFPTGLVSFFEGSGRRLLSLPERGVLLHGGRGDLIVDRILGVGDFERIGRRILLADEIARSDDYLASAYFSYGETHIRIWGLDQAGVPQLQGVEAHYPNPLSSLVYANLTVYALDPLAGLVVCDATNHLAPTIHGVVDLGVGTPVAQTRRGSDLLLLGDLALVLVGIADPLNPTALATLPLANAYSCVVDLGNIVGLGRANDDSIDFYGLDAQLQFNYLSTTALPSAPMFLAASAGVLYVATASDGVIALATEDAQNFQEIGRVGTQANPKGLTTHLDQVAVSFDGYEKETVVHQAACWQNVVAVPPHVDRPNDAIGLRGEFMAGHAVAFVLSSPGRMSRLAVYDVRGRLVATVWSGSATGETRVEWRVPRLARGVYYALLDTDRGRWSRKLLLTR